MYRQLSRLSKISQTCKFLSNIMEVFFLERDTRYSRYRLTWNVKREFEIMRQPSGFP